MTGEQFGVRYASGRKVFGVPSLAAAQHIAGSGAKVLSKVGRSWVEVSPGFGAATHSPWISSITLGTELTCSCGRFRSRMNSTPRDGGKRYVEEQFTQHLAEVAASLQEA